jgi:2-polyprenyl-6-methoxyphenol hydroxylase-like FAD-dependent oxidoreductase
MLPYVEQSPRAAVYHTVAVRELDRAGVLQDCLKRGSTGSEVRWQKVNGETIAEVDRKSLPGEYSVLVLGQHELAEVIFTHYKRCEGSKVLFNHKVTALEQSESGADLTVETPEGIKHFHARYVIGADGGRSSVRRLCDIPFEGFTWDFNLVACNVIYPFEKYGFLGGNFIVDHDHWALIAKLAEPGLWRCSYGELPGLTHDQLLERLPWKFDCMFPGPKPLKYELKMASPYKINQRCATTFHKGAVLLAGDAAHLCNPFGGMGLTGGILDAGALGDVLIAVMKDGKSEALLTRYSDLRRKVFVEIVDPRSQANVRRISETDPDTVGQTDPFLKMLNDPAIDKTNLRGLDDLYIDVMAGFE